MLCINAKGKETRQLNKHKFVIVVTTVVVPLLLSYVVTVKGVFSPAPPYCGYLKPSHSFVIILRYLVCLTNFLNIKYSYNEINID